MKYYSVVAVKEFSPKIMIFMKFSYILLLWKNINLLKTSYATKIERLLRNDLREMKTPLLEFLEDNKLPSSVVLHVKSLIKKLRKLPDPDDDTDVLDDIFEIFRKIKQKLAILRLSIKEEQVLKAFHFWFRKGGDKHLNKIIHNVVFLGKENSNIIRMVKSLRNVEVEPEVLHEEAVEELGEMEETIFGNKTKSIKVLAKLDPEEYKEYRRVKTRSDMTSLMVVEELIAENDLGEPVSVGRLNALLRERDIDPIFDPGFDGKISVDNRFIFHTGDGKEIVDNVGTNVRVQINPEWDTETDDTFCYTSFNIKGKQAYHYTSNFRKKKGQGKFADVQKLGGIIEQIRARWMKDFQSKDEETKIKAGLCMLVDHVYPRIGGSKHEKKHKTRGLHNLKVRNLKERKNGVAIVYIGKKSQKQNQLITDPKLIKFVKSMAKGKEPGEYLFSFNNGDLVKPNEINKYLKDLGSPVTIHRFRTYHATRIARDLLNNKKFREKATKEDKEKFYIQTMKQVAKLLGDRSWKTPMKDYVDHSVTKEYFERHGINLPKAIRLAIGRAIVEVLGSETKQEMVPTIVSSIKYLASLSDLSFGAWMSEQKV